MDGGAGGAAAEAVDAHPSSAVADNAALKPIIVPTPRQRNRRQPAYETILRINLLDII
jgi:hypothetical protein